MLIDCRDVAPYLLDRGLVDPKAVVSGDLVIADNSRRNRVFHVLRQHAPSYLIKQGMTSEGMTTVAREANFYITAQSQPRSQSFLQYLPHFFDYDPRESILILELLRGAEDLRQYAGTTRRFSTILAKTLGSALGLLHSDMHEVAGLISGGSAQLSVPWVLAAHKPAAHVLTSSSSGTLKVIKILQQIPSLGVELDRLDSEWQLSSTIHQDLKWDNCLTYAPSGSTRRTRLAIIDWEAVTIGDPLWDVGSVFSDYLASWVMSMPITAGAVATSLPGSAQLPIKRMQPAVEAFWNAYALKMRLDAERSEHVLEHSMRYSGARLIQTAFEQMQMRADLTGNVVILLQMALNIMTQPLKAASDLLNLRIRESTG